MPDDCSSATAVDATNLCLQVCPVVAVGDRRLIAVDLLPTWSGPDTADTALDDMWAKAKSSGQEQVRLLMQELINSACKQWLDWFSQGVAPRMSLAVITDAVSSAQEVENILTILRKAGVPTSKLQLRLSEASLKANKEDCVATAKQLRSAGLSAALDQVGDAYAVVSELETIPFDSIRIQAGFVAKVESDAMSRLVVATLTKLSTERGVTVIGCGVDEAEQWDFLQESGCDGMLGDLVTTPMPASELMDWLYMSRWQRIHRTPTPSDEVATTENGQPAAAVSHAELAPINAKLHALVVDDDPLVVKVLAKQLSNLGFADIMTANDGEQAMLALQSNATFDIIFCDLKMPGTDGMAFLRRAATLIPNVAVVLISSVDAKILRSAASLARAHQLSLLGTLKKPISIDALSAVIQRLSRHASISEKPSDSKIEIDDLRKALSGGNIEPYFQPQVDAQTGVLVGAEALARWRKGDGWIAPDKFIALAETHGLINELTDVIVAGTLQAISLWDQAGLTLNVSVNVSMDTLSRLDFPEHMNQLCSDANINPSRVQIEVTESKAMSDPLSTLEVATRLRLCGFDLSIDDFGTGYSTLSQLREMPFSELKVDQSFVGLAHKDREARSIVDSSLKLARKLNLKTVAEGVETSEDWRLLNSLGCDILQGYFVSHARSSEDFLNWAQTEYAELLSGKVLPP
ncbi:MAG: EAL domain-containing protein [Oceanococcus sp.]